MIIIMDRVHFPLQVPRFPFSLFGKIGRMALGIGHVNVLLKTSGIRVEHVMRYVRCTILYYTI